MASCQGVFTDFIYILMGALNDSEMVNIEHFQKIPVAAPRTAPAVADVVVAAAVVFIFASVSLDYWYAHIVCSHFL